MGIVGRYTVVYGNNKRHEAPQKPNKTEFEIVGREEVPQQQKTLAKKVSKIDSSEENSGLVVAVVITIAVASVVTIVFVILIAIVVRSYKLRAKKGNLRNTSSGERSRKYLTI